MSESGTDTPETYFAREARTSNDDELLSFLDHALLYARCIPLTDPAAIEAGIADLACEVARRGLQVPTEMEVTS